MTVLVAYATWRGSTRGVGERIGSRLSASGLAVDVRPVTDVQDVTPYEAAVVGSAIHGGMWLPEGAEFIDRHGSALCGRPTWLFSVSTVGDEESMFSPAVARRMRSMRKEPKQLLEFRQALDPVEHRNFAGAISPADWPTSGRLFFKAFGGRYGDHRNWAAIDAWGDRIATYILDSEAVRLQAH